VVIGTFFGSVGCMCGHFSLINAAFLVPTAAFAWCWSLHGVLVLRALVSSLPVLCLGKVVLDVLWNGHEPLLSRASRSAPEFLLVPPSLAIGGAVLLLFVGSLVAVRRKRALQLETRE
jgi:hypothetical protein